MRAWLTLIGGLGILAGPSVSAAPATTADNQASAHAARTASLSNAAQSGLAAGAELKAQAPVVVHPGRSAPSGASPVVEPPSRYANAPADMRAFCTSARASACLFLPPNQTRMVAWQEDSGAITILDLDGLVSQAQCLKEGGRWGHFPQSGRPGLGCAYIYPGSALTRFTPAPSFALTSSVKCDRSLWNYTVDEHGAVQIQLRKKWYQSPWFATGASPACIVRTTIG